MEKKLKILVSNDDGIDSLGIYELVKALREIGDVTVVAPWKEQSAVGHAITMKVPLRVIKYYKNGDFFGYAVDGTPADCVKMGVRNIMTEPPDIVVSGINHGSNTACNVIYSGTVSAAREAVLMNLPAFAISVASHSVSNFGFAGKVAQKICNFILQNKLNKGTLLNINVPDAEEKSIKGIRITTQGNSRWDDIYEKRQDPYGRDYFWLTGNFMDDNEDDLADQKAIINNYVSITPIQLDSTDHKAFQLMKDWNIEKLFS